MKQPNSTAKAPTTLIELVYELLDAHYDTARLAHDTLDQEHWAAHIDYLRRLQRVGREVVAEAAA